MEFAARYSDGAVADTKDVLASIDSTDSKTLAIHDKASREVIDRWPADKAYLLHSRAMELRIANSARTPGARLAVTGIADMRNALGTLPTLHHGQRRDWWRQVQILSLATAALGSVIFAYLFGVPLLADQLVGIIPPEWETRIGDTAAGQIEQALTGGAGFIACDTDPQSPANVAIARFVHDTFDGLDSPFTPVVTVTRTDIPNAFALPGGRTYYFSALLRASRTADEFAGVLAHELGHVYYRHGMETLIASSATGLLVGFIVGDLTGVSVAGAVGSALIDNRFSRRAEAQADAFAGRTAQRLGYDPKGLVDLLERVAGDDEYSRALALFSNHPLTDDRRRALEAFASAPNPKPAFTDAEWQAIRRMCPTLLTPSVGKGVTTP